LPGADPIYFDSLNGELLGTFRPNSRWEIVPRFNVTYQVPWRAPVMDENYYDKSARRIRGRLLGRFAALDQLQITAGGDVIFDHAALRAPEVADTLQAPWTNGSDQIDYQTYAGFIEAYSENPIVNVSAGARYDHMTSVGGALVPRLVLLRSFGIVSLKALFSMSFRAPGIENVNLGLDIRPEKTRVFEFEGAVDLTPQQRLSANVFDIAINAPIAYSVSMGEAYVNLGKQGTRGFEVAYRLRHPVIKAEANYSFYIPSYADNTATYDVPGNRNQFLGAPAHRGSVRATIRPFDQLGITPSVIVLGPRFTVGPPDAAGVATAEEKPALALANLFIYRDNVGVRGLRVGLGFYNIFGADYRFIRPYARTPVDTSVMAAQEAYLFDHAPLPGLDREVLLQLSYLLEPS
jgi:outer membrane receptor for ferrienterochelin and colicins